MAMSYRCYDDENELSKISKKNHPGGPKLEKKWYQKCDPFPIGQRGQIEIPNHIFFSKNNQSMIKWILARAWE